MQIVMNRGRKDEREHHGAKDATDNGDGKRLEHGGTSTDTESQGQHARDGGQRSHGNGAQAAAAGLDHGVFPTVAEGAKALVRIEEQDTVLGDDADDHDHAHERGDVKRGARDEQSEKTAKTGEKSGSKDRRWR